MSNINPVAAHRMATSQITGEKLLQMFQALEQQMGILGADGQYAQMQFVSDPAEIKEGDVIPELHLSLRTYQGPMIGQPVQFDEGDS